MYEIWEVVKINDYESMPLILVDRTSDFEEAIEIKNQNKNFILVDKNGSIIKND